MMTLQRFKVLIEAYGAGPRRWPEGERAQMAMLPSASVAAREILEEARHFDALLDAARTDEAAILFQAGEQAAALARLRSGVAARIAPPLPGQKRRGVVQGRLSLILTSAGVGRAATASWYGWMAMTVGGGVALIAGLWIGGMHGSGTPVDLIAILQPSPIHGLVW